MKKAQNTDSIIKLALLDKDEQFMYFENYINLKDKKKFKNLKRLRKVQILKALID